METLDSITVMAGEIDLDAIAWRAAQILHPAQRAKVAVICTSDLEVAQAIELIADRLAGGPAHPTFIVHPTKSWLGVLLTCAAEAHSPEGGTMTTQIVRTVILDKTVDRTEVLGRAARDRQQVRALCSSIDHLHELMLLADEFAWHHEDEAVFSLGNPDAPGYGLSLTIEFRRAPEHVIEMRRIEADLALATR